MTDKPGNRGLSRRSLLQRGSLFAAAGLAGGLTGFPYINRMALRAQDAPLKFWQFYGPGGPVATQVAGFRRPSRTGTTATTRRSNSNTFRTPNI
jgi:multiple sugar transport system substrate-binding protein